jgi:hypothetical protein
VQVLVRRIVARGVTLQSGDGCVKVGYQCIQKHYHRGRREDFAPAGQELSRRVSKPGMHPFADKFANLGVLHIEFANFTSLWITGGLLNIILKCPAGPLPIAPPSGVLFALADVPAIPFAG